MRKIRHRLNEIIANHTGRDIEDIATDTERDKFMSPEEAKEYGIIDEILVPETKEKKEKKDTKEKEE